MNSIEKAIARLAATTDVVSQQDTKSLEKIGSKVDTEQRIVSKATPRLLELNFESLARAGYLTPATMRGNLAEEYRFLKRSLLPNIDLIEAPLNRYDNLIAITSALPGEGKTFTSFNLAMSIATALDATTVLLIDCDLVGRSLTNLVGLADAPGLTDLLLDPQLDLHDVIIHTNIPKLRLMPAGRIYHDAIELLASERIRGMAHELSARYHDRVILFDTMPLLLNSQVLLLTSLVGKILVVVEEGKTPQKIIKEAVLLLDQDKAIGMILNKCS